MPSVPTPPSIFRISRKIRASVNPEAKAYGYAIRLLAYRDRACREIKERLAKKGFENHCIAKTIRRLQDEALLNDLHFAINFCREKIDHKRFGRRRLLLELKKKGLDKEVVDEALHLIFQDYDEEQILHCAIEERTSQIGSPRSTRELSTLINYLARRGYPYTKIWGALRSLKIPIPTEEG